MEENNGGGAVEGFSLSGAEVAELPDKHFEIVAEPYYKELDSLDKPGEKKRKLIIPVRLANGTLADWFANKTSQRVIMAKRTRIFRAWVGFRGEFEVKS